MKRTLKRWILVACLLSVVGVSAGAWWMPSAHAQHPCGPTPCPSTQDDSMREKLEALTDAAKKIVPTFINAVHDPLGTYFDNLAYLLAYIVTFIFLMRLIKQGGDPEDFYWSIGRMALMFALLGFCAYRTPSSGQGTDLPTFFGRIGVGIAYGDPGDNGSFLGRKVKERQLKFSNGYSDFVSNSFYYEIDGEDRLIEYPDDDASGKQVFAAPNSGGEVLNRIANAVQSDRGWSMDRLFQFLNVSRGVVEFGDLFLLILNGFLVAAVKLAAPFMVAISIDREFAQRVGKNFAWGSAVVLIVMPIISQIVRWCAYSIGAIPFGHIKNPYFVFDATTGSVVVNGSPEWMIIISASLMMICGLCMFASPFISYKLAQGGVFEAIAGTVSGWMGAMIGTGISMWSAATGAAISKQAADQTATAQAAADTRSAEGSLTSAIIQANTKHRADGIRSSAEASSASNMAMIEASSKAMSADVSAQEKVSGFLASLGEEQGKNQARLQAEGFQTDANMREAVMDGTPVIGAVAKEMSDAKNSYYMGVGGPSAVPTGAGQQQYVPALTGSNINQAVQRAGTLPNESSCAWTGNSTLKNLGLIPQNARTSANARQSMNDLGTHGWQRVNPSDMQAGDAVFFVGQRWGKQKYGDLGGAGFHQMTATGNGTVSGSPGRGVKFEQNVGGMLRSRGGQMVVMRAPAFTNSASAEGGRVVGLPIDKNDPESLFMPKPGMAIPTGRTDMGTMPFPVRKLVAGYEKTRIEVGGANAAAQWGTNVKINAAYQEAQGMKAIAWNEAAGKQQVAWQTHGMRMQAAGVEKHGSIQAAQTQFQASKDAIQIRHEAALKQASLIRLSTLVTSFGSTVANQAHGAMQQYNRF